MGQHDQTPDVSECADSVREEARRAKARDILTRAIGLVTDTEKLIIWRRREGLNQNDAGFRLGVSRKAYADLERNASTKRIDIPFIGDLYSNELCFLLRRRSGCTIPHCAEQIGVSRYWYNLMELGKASPETLVQYWIENEG